MCREVKVRSVNNESSYKKQAVLEVGELTVTSGNINSAHKKDHISSNW